MSTVIESSSRGQQATESWICGLWEARWRCADGLCVWATRKAMYTCVLLMKLVVTVAAAADWSVVTFPTPANEPAKNMKGDPIISGGMPIGDGETTALVFPVTAAFNTSDSFGLEPGVHVMLGMMTAMASDMAPMPLGIVSIKTEPPLFSAADSFRQSLYLENATVEITTSVGSVLVWVDASTTNRVVARASAGLAITAAVQSLRPNATFTYSGRCSSPTSAPDVFSRPAGADSVGLSHTNRDADVALLNVPAAFNATLEQQGLGSLAGELQAMDAWRGRTFGFVVSSDALFASARHDALRSRTRGSAAGAAANAAPADIVITTLSEQVTSADGLLMASWWPADCLLIASRDVLLMEAWDHDALSSCDHDALNTSDHDALDAGCERGGVGALDSAAARLPPQAGRGGGAARARRQLGRLLAALAHLGQRRRKPPRRKLRWRRRRGRRQPTARADAPLRADALRAGGASGHVGADQVQRHGVHGAAASGDECVGADVPSMGELQLVAEHAAGLLEHARPRRLCLAHHPLRVTSPVITYEQPPIS